MASAESVARHKRADGDGTIRQRANGTWEARLMVGYLPDGKPDRRSVYGPTQAEVRRKLTELRNQHDTGSVLAADKARDTVAGFIEHWLHTHAASVRPSTHRTYTQLLTLHVVPALGKYKLAALRADDVQRLYASLQGTIAPRTIHHVHTVLHTALADAVKWLYVTRNVCAIAEPPKVHATELHPPDATALGAILDAGAADRFLPLWTLAVYTGARQGELLGLQWPDLDLAAGTLTINRTLLQTTTAAKPAYAPPKTNRSRRTIVLPEVAVAALRTHRREQARHKLELGPDYTDHGLVFATGVGTPFLARNVLRAFKVALVRAGLPTTIRFHDLRHAAATSMRAAGVDLKTVSERLGHANIATTANIYTHGVQQADAAAASSLATLIESKRKRG